MPRPLLQILLAVSLLILANYYWSPGSTLSLTADTSERRQALPKTYLHQTRAWSFDDQGRLTDILEADKVEQFTRGNVSNLTQPRFYAHSEDDKTWSASAKRGRFFHGNERLVLRNKVVLLHDQTGARVDTHTLDLYVKRKTANSSSKVTITQGESITTADGMVADLNVETIELKPNVETTYVAENTHAQ